jgi:hypothetical protein
MKYTLSDDSPTEATDIRETTAGLPCRFVTVYNDLQRCARDSWPVSTVLQPLTRIGL